LYDSASGKPVLSKTQSLAQSGFLQATWQNFPGTDFYTLRVRRSVTDVLSVEQMQALGSIAEAVLL
jgi:hypothetical protein